MIQCKNCGNTPQGNDKIVWKCNSCGKLYGAKLSFLQKIWSNKDSNVSQSIMKCKQCGNTLDDGNESIAWQCSCGNKTDGILEDFIDVTAYNAGNTYLAISPKDNFCSHCGTKLHSTENYCPNCGVSKYGEVKNKFCPECGAVITSDKKFCTNCGYKVQKDINDNILPNKVLPVMLNTEKKKLSMRVLVRICAIVVLICGLGFLGKTYIPKLLVSTEALLEDGKYKEAYSKAKNNEKDAVLAENLIAFECQEVIDTFKNPSSFQLINVWFKKGEKNFVMSVSGENGFGGVTSSYILFYFNKNEYEVVTSISNMDNEKVYSFDDTDDKLNKILNNSARKIIGDIVGSYHKLNKSTIKNINNLHKKGDLLDVELLDETKTLYPKGDSDEI